MDPEKAAFAQKTDAAHARRGDRRRRPLPRALGAGRADRRRWCKQMAHDPIVLRARQPRPGDPARGGARGEPRRHHRHRAGPTIPNQVNNVLCFPFIFRGALDVGATEINDEMQIACVEGIAALARASSSAEAAAAYQGERLSLRARLPDPQGLRSAAPRHRRRARSPRRRCATGVATRPVADLNAYRERAQPRRSIRSAFIMRRVFEVAHTVRSPHRLRRGRGRAGAARRLRDERGGRRAGRS